MGTGSNRTIMGAYKTSAGSARLGHMESSLACLRMLEAHEAAHGLAFDWVTRYVENKAGMAGQLEHTCQWFEAEGRKRTTFTCLRGALPLVGKQ